MRWASTSAAVTRKILASRKSSQTRAWVGLCGMGPSGAVRRFNARAISAFPPVDKAIVGLGHLDALIKAHGGRRREQQGRGRGAARFRPRLLDQALADALTLAGLVDGKIGEV